MTQFKQYKSVLIVAAIVIVALGLAIASGILAFSLGKDMASRFAKTSIPTATMAFPELRTSTPTAVPTKTGTLSPTGTPTKTPTPTATPTFTPTPTPTPRVIITEVKALGRLETSKYMMSTIIDLKRDPTNIWEEILGTDSLLLLAEGEVVAGIDMTQITKQDIVIQGDYVSMTLPKPEILYSKIDNNRTYVYERVTGLFLKPDIELEGEARQLAEQAMVDRALEGEILEQAEANARMQIEAFLRALGFTDIVIVVRGE
jgi:hypothetical protein